eukprot:CAMPEP_0116856728 /NCGR_PEP_ID=MMETSP0418-20121206/20101_1 /TAXON_ID=1158023 /ORGANISM="Astrosyne radiata, Strain 13vi08-1A" /LENGTH=52 /DNA_ID=CAMNT_0004490217 /DNA_START=38 /DNA_END=193 /DNA_ORIENTATION=-
MIRDKMKRSASGKSPTVNMRDNSQRTDGALVSVLISLARDDDCATRVSGLGS